MLARIRPLEIAVGRRVQTPQWQRFSLPGDAVSCWPRIVATARHRPLRITELVGQHPACGSEQPPAETGRGARRRSAGFDGGFEGEVLHRCAVVGSGARSDDGHLTVIDVDAAAPLELEAARDDDAGIAAAVGEHEENDL